MALSLNPGNNKRTHTSQCLTYLSILVVFFQYLVFHYLNGTKYSIISIELNSILAFAAIQQEAQCIRTLYSGVPGDKRLIFDPSWTNMWVMVVIREWRSLYSSYSAQKSSWYLWRCSKLMMVPYVLQGDTNTCNDDVSLTGTNHPGYISPCSLFSVPNSWYFCL